MNMKHLLQRLGHPLAFLGSLIAFIMASGNLFNSQPVPYKLLAASVPVLGFISYWVLSDAGIKRQIGLGLVINGMAFWGIGWFLILLMDPVIGWWVYVAGWLALSIGFLIYGSVEAHKKGLPNWVVVVLLLGLLPVTAELASPYRFATELKAGGQLFTMFAYSFGWILIGKLVSTLPAQAPQFEKATVAASSSNA